MSCRCHGNQLHFWRNDFGFIVRGQKWSNVGNFVNIWNLSCATLSVHLSESKAECYLTHCDTDFGGVNLKLTWTVIYKCKRQPNFFYRAFIKNRVLTRCMSWLVSFARANWRWKERELSENNKIKKYFPLWDSNPGPSVYEASTLPLSHEDWCQSSDKRSPGFTCAIFWNLPVARVRCSKIICRLFLSSDMCIVLMFTN